MSSCYKQNIMFKVEEYESSQEIISALSQAESNYKLKEGDFIGVRIETNNGEILVDPNYQMRLELGVRNMAQTAERDQPMYLIDHEGNVKLPLVGYIKLSGYTLYQSDSILMKEYSEFYKDPFVITSISNRRAFIFNGQEAQVILLNNENTSIIEALASTGGIKNFNKSNNIRLIRGDLKNPYVEVIDLSTIEGMTRANLQLQNRDIIYVEPVRRVIVEATRDYSPIISLFTSVITLIVLVSR